MNPNHRFNWDWTFAVMQALLEGADKQVPDGAKVWEVVGATHARAREIYSTRNPKAQGDGAGE